MTDDAVTTEEGMEASDLKGNVVQRRARRPSVLAYTQTLQKFAFTFQNVSVYVPKEKGCCRCWTSCCAGASRCFCLVKPLSMYLMDNFGWAVEQTDPYHALNDASGFVQSGQMVLVLSPDTQYSSALIQTCTYEYMSSLSCRPSSNTYFIVFLLLFCFYD